MAPSTGTPEGPTDRPGNHPATHSAEDAAALLGAMADLGEEVKRLAKVADRAVPRTAARRTLRVTVGIAALTLLLTLGIENYGIRSCFLNPPTGGPVRTACGVVFPGWEASRRDADQRLATFNGLLDRIDRLERQAR